MVPVGLTARAPAASFERTRRIARPQSPLPPESMEHSIHSSQSRCLEMIIARLGLPGGPGPQSLLNPSVLPIQSNRLKLASEICRDVMQLRHQFWKIRIESGQSMLQVAEAGLSNARRVITRSEMPDMQAH